jgi:glyceraldehyde-3-phosphate dehydrogenase/erythrose-4-phosphate dehydrogenase
MSVRVGINGFGRIGKLTLRSAMEHNASRVQIMGINDPFLDIEYAAYLLQYDTVHGNLLFGSNLFDRKIPARSDPRRRLPDH